VGRTVASWLASVVAADEVKNNSSATGTAISSQARRYAPARNTSRRVGHRIDGPIDLIDLPIDLRSLSTTSLIRTPRP